MRGDRRAAGQIPGVRVRAPAPTGAWRAGGGGLALWTWLLCFPFFGPLLGPAFGASAQEAGYVFAAGHVAGLLLWSRRRAGRVPPPLVHPAVAALTLAAFVLSPGGRPLLAGALALVLGFLSAALVLAWLDQLRRSPRPAEGLAIAGGGANVVLWLLSLPTETPAAIRQPGAAVVVAALLVLWAAQSAGPHRAPSRPSGGVPRPADADGKVGGVWPGGDGHPPRRLPPVPLLVFALAAYAGGGIMYAALAPATASQPPVEWLGVWPYIATFAAAAARTPPPRLERLVAFTLSVLGLGFALLAASQAFAPLFAISWGLVMVGLGLADAYYWRRVIALAGTGGGWQAGPALAWNVIVVAGTALATDATHLGALARLPVAGALGAAVLFALAPFLQGAAAPPPPAPGAPEAAGPAADGAWVAGLTRSERRVLALLLNGRTDAEIAATLYVSRNTVKYHVRHVLRKAGYGNRRDLRAAHAGGALRLPEGLGVEGAPPAVEGRPAPPGEGLVPGASQGRRARPPVPPEAPPT